MIQRARAMMRRFGIKATVEHGLRALIWPVADSGTLLFFGRTIGAEVPLDLPAGMRIRIGTEDDCADLAKMIDSPLPGGDDGGAPAGELMRRAADYERRLARGDRLCVIVDSSSGALVHMRWNTTREESIPECGLLMVPPAGAAYTFDVFTHDAFRGRDLIAVSRAFADADLRDRGISRVYWYVRHDNRSCLRAHPSDSEDHQRLRYLRLGSPAKPILVVPLGSVLPPISRQALA